MIKLGLNTWLWTHIFTEEHLYSIDEASELGSETIDFCINDPFVFPTSKAKERLQKYDMDVVVTTAMPKHCNPISPEKAERDFALKYIKELVDVSAILGSSLIGGVNYTGSGYFSGKPRSSQEIEYCLKFLSSACEYADQFGIDIALEPVKRFETHFLNTASQALELIDISGIKNLKVHLDTFHMNIEEANIVSAIESCGDKLVHMHFVENNRDTPGKGHIPWIDVFSALESIKYEGSGCIETFNPKTLDETCSLTYLTRKFADSPEELAQDGLTFLKTIRETVRETV